MRSGCEGINARGRRVSCETSCNRLVRAAWACFGVMSRMDSEQLGVTACSDILEVRAIL